MDTASVWNTLAGISVGTIFAWGIVIIAIITALVKGIKSLFSFFQKYKQLKDDNEKQSEMLHEHDKILKEMQKTLISINERLDEQKEHNLKQIRSLIVDKCYDALRDNEIPIGKHKALEEMYEEYTKIFNGNGYVRDLMKRVNNIQIVGTLDE